MLSRDLAETVLTLMERGALGERVPAGQWATFARELADAINEAQLATCQRCGAGLAPADARDPYLCRPCSAHCLACGNALAETERDFCRPCRVVISADLDARNREQRDQGPDEPGSRCSAACGYCGRCGGA